MEPKKKIEVKENKPAVINKNITDEVLIKVTTLRDAGLLRLPKEYSPENALKGAYIILQDVKTKEGKSVLEVCSKESIALALLKMVTEGLTPLKKHGSFIPRGNSLNWEREYDGDVALAQRAGLDWIRSRVIYENDEFKYQVIPETGVITIIEHKQEIENIDITKIKGAYAIWSFKGITDVLVMNIRQIKQSWLQGSMKGNSGAHTNFTDEMCRRTVERRACKPIIRRSDDSYLEDEPEFEESKTDTLKANAEDISFTHVEEVKEEKQSEQKEPTGNEETKKEPTQQELNIENKPGF